MRSRCMEFKPNVFAGYCEHILVYYSALAELGGQWQESKAQQV